MVGAKIFLGVIAVCLVGIVVMGLISCCIVAGEADRQAEREYERMLANKNACQEGNE